LLYVSITNYHVNCNVMLHLHNVISHVHVIVGDANIQQIYFVSEMTITRVLFSYLVVLVGGSLA